MNIIEIEIPPPPPPPPPPQKKKQYIKYRKNFEKLKLNI